MEKKKKNMNLRFNFKKGSLKGKLVKEKFFSIPTGLAPPRTA